MSRWDDLKYVTEELRKRFPEMAGIDDDSDMHDRAWIVVNALDDVYQYVLEQLFDADTMKVMWVWRRKS